MKKVKNLDLWIILGVITIIAIVAVIILAVKPGQIKGIEDVKEVTVENYKSMGSSKYFVFVYNKENPGIAQLNDEIIKYAEYARTHKKAPKIYLLDVDAKKNPTAYDDFKTEKISISKTNTSSLITVENGKYTVTTDGSKICNMLIDYETGKN